MVVESIFTRDELDAAKSHGATISYADNRTILTFPDEAAYDRWAREQQQLHPDRWTHSMRVRIKD